MTIKIKKALIDFNKFTKGFVGKFAVQKKTSFNNVTSYNLYFEVPLIDLSILKEYQKKRSAGSQEPDLTSNFTGSGFALLSFQLLEDIHLKPLGYYPKSYLNFYGNIAYGEYGSGNVEPFDFGYYELLSRDNNSFTLSLMGHIFKGPFVLSDQSSNWTFQKIISQYEICANENSFTYNVNEFSFVFDGKTLSLYKDNELQKTFTQETLPNQVSIILYDLDLPLDNKLDVLNTFLKSINEKQEKKSNVSFNLSRIALLLKTCSVLDYVQPGLDPKVWDTDGNLRKRHRKTILNHITKILERFRLYNYGKWMKQIILTGSMTSYQYHKHSDVDIHIYVDVPEFIQTEWNGNGGIDTVEAALTEVTIESNIKDPVKLKETKHYVEYYFDLTEFDESTIKDGAWDIINDTWIVTPRTLEAEFNPEIAFSSVLKDVEEVAQELDIDLGKLKRETIDAQLLVDTVESFSPANRVKLRKRLDTKLNEIEQDIEFLTRKVEKFKQERKDDYDSTSVGNLQFKYLQRFGYISILKNLQSVIEDNEVSENELKKITDILHKEQE